VQQFARPSHLVVANTRLRADGLYEGPAGGRSNIRHENNSAPRPIDKPGPRGAVGRWLDTCRFEVASSHQIHPVGVALLSAGV
jgi:hypothetical protein